MIYQTIRDALHKTVGSKHHDSALGNEPEVTVYLKESTRQKLLEELESQNMFIIPEGEYEASPRPLFTKMVFPFLAVAVIVEADEESIEYNGKKECISFL